MVLIVFFPNFLNSCPDSFLFLFVFRAFIRGKQFLPFFNFNDPLFRPLEVLIYVGTEIAHYESKQLLTGVVTSRSIYERIPGNNALRYQEQEESLGEFLLSDRCEGKGCARWMLEVT